MPFKMNRPVSTSMTSAEFGFRFIRMTRHSIVNSSMILSVRKALPSSVLHWTTSYHQTWFLHLDLRRTHERPSAITRPVRVVCGVLSVRHADLADGFCHRYALAVQPINLPQLGNDPFGLVGLSCRLRSSCFQYIRVDQFNGGGSTGPKMMTCCLSNDGLVSEVF